MCKSTHLGTQKNSGSSFSFNVDGVSEDFNYQDSCVSHLKMLMWIGLAVIALIVIPLQWFFYKIVATYIKEKDEEFAKDSQYTALNQ